MRKQFTTKWAILFQQYIRYGKTNQTNTRLKKNHEIPRNLKVKVSSPEALYMNSRNAISLFLEKCLEMSNKFVINAA